MDEGSTIPQPAARTKRPDAVISARAHLADLVRVTQRIAATAGLAHESHASAALGSTEALLVVVSEEIAVLQERLSASCRSVALERAHASAPKAA